MAALADCRCALSQSPLHTASDGWKNTGKHRGTRKITPFATATPPRSVGLATAQPAVHAEAYSQRFDPGHISAPTIPAVRRAIRTTDWRPSSLRVVVLFVDQPEPAAPTAAEISHADVQSLIDEAQRARVHLLTVRLSASGDLAALRTELLWERIAAETDGRCAVWDESYLPGAWFGAWLSQRMRNDPATVRRGSPDPVEAFDRRSPSPSQTENLNVPFTGRLRRVDGSVTSSDVVRAWIPAQIDGTRVLSDAHRWPRTLK